ncbi:MAG: hypothetical protein KME46_29800 [Brasilonema angustatum HA4187-MV1]|jgi:hypothetical protein|nr:hypothetical protein [Brasilonema angustatum HA4187-MV1]
MVAKKTVFQELTTAELLEGITTQLNAFEQYLENEEINYAVGDVNTDLYGEEDQFIDNLFVGGGDVEIDGIVNDDDFEIYVDDLFRIV